MTSDKMFKLRQMGKFIKILYVEDDKSLSRQFFNFLKKISPNVNMAHDGIEALKLYKRSNYDIVITDIEMPKMDGIEMIEKIRDLNSKQLIAVTSAYNNQEYLLKLIDNNIDKFLIKPFNKHKMFKVISQLVIQAYRDKKTEQEEIRLKSTQMLNSVLLDKIEVPLIVISDKVEFFNYRFTNAFNSEGTCILKNFFNLSDLFDEEDKYSKLSNEDIIKDLLQNDSVVKNIYTHNKKISQRYIINIVSIENNKYLLSFYDVDMVFSKINDDKDDNIDMLTSLYTREAFKTQLSEFINDDKEYSFVCFGLKNIKDLIKSFGVISLRDMYKQIGNNLVQLFKEEIEKNIIKLYYFDRNHFVAIVKNTNLDITKEILDGFGEHSVYSKDNSSLSEPLNLDVLSQFIQKNQSKKNIMGQVDSLLYMLND